MEVCQLKQKLEEMLRQRERELTALKGALKEEVANHDKEIEVLREQCSADMEKLRSSMEQVSQVCARPEWPAHHHLCFKLETKKENQVLNNRPKPSLHACQFFLCSAVWGLQMKFHSV